MKASHDPSARGPEGGPQRTGMTVAEAERWLAPLL